MVIYLHLNFFFRVLWCFESGSWILYICIFKDKAILHVFITELFYQVIEKEMIEQIEIGLFVFCGLTDLICKVDKLNYHFDSFSMPFANTGRE